MARTLNDQCLQGWTSVACETHRFPSFHEYKSVWQYYFVATIILVCTFGTEPVMMTMMDSPPTLSETKVPTFLCANILALRKNTGIGDTV